MPTTSTRNKTQSKTTISRKKKPAKRRKAAKKNKSLQRLNPFLRYMIVVAIVAVFISGFYYFFIRPYSYRWKPCYGYQGYGVCLPYGYDIHGLDISHHQGKINWEELATNRTAIFPLHFIFMKATEGGDLADSTFIRNFDLARQHGFMRGAYHFFSPRTDAVKQADFFIRNVRLEKGDLPPVLDVEVLGKNDGNQLREKVKLWLNRVETHYGVKPIIYSSYKFKTKYLNDSTLNTYPYWIAHYYVDSVRYTGKWNFWQHSDVGEVHGIPKKVDLNIFNGTLEELMELAIK